MSTSYGPESLHWVVTAKMVGQLVPLRNSSLEKGSSIAVLVYHNIPEVKWC